MCHENTCMLTLKTTPTEGLKLNTLLIYVKEDKIVETAFYSEF